MGFATPGAAPVPRPVPRLVEQVRQVPVPHEVPVPVMQQPLGFGGYGAGFGGYGAGFGYGGF